MSLSENQIQRKNNNSIILELIIEDNMISDQLIKNMNAHRKLFLKIVKINKNLEFINDDSNVISSLLYEMQKNKN